MVSVDDDVMEVRISSHGKGEDGSGKTIQGEQNILRQHEGREDKIEDSFIEMMEAYIPCKAKVVIVGNH